MTAQPAPAPAPEAMSPLDVMISVFSRWFGDQSWAAWWAWIKITFALPISSDEFEASQPYHGRTIPLDAPARESWVIAGRRAGKSEIAAFLAVYSACFVDHSGHLSPGERGTCMLIAADRKQARVVFGYIRALLREVPMLALLIERETAEAIRLTNGISIEVHTASFRAVRGYTIVCAILDEVAFWRDDTSANPDAEIVAALRPAMATVPGSFLLGISSPYARRGVLWEAHRDHFGRDGDRVLVWQAPSLAMNPTIPSHIIDGAYEADPAAAAAEWGGQFRTDRESFVLREAVEACVESGVRERMPVSDASYSAFTDPSGGVSDSFTLAVAHLEGGQVILDAVRERRPPFSPDAVTREFAALLKSYHVTSVRGDRYAGEWPRERFREHGVEYRPAGKSKSDLYAALLPALNSGRVRLLDHPVLAAQLLGLERRTSRGGRDSIDHPPRGHDDVSNAAAGAIVLALESARAKAVTDFTLPDVGGRVSLWDPDSSLPRAPDHWI